VKPNTPPSPPVQMQPLHQSSIQETPHNHTATHINARDPTGNWSIVKKQINSIQADLGANEAPLLTVSLTCQHSSHPQHHSISKNARVHRYKEYSSWHPSPALPIKLLASPENPGKPAVTHEEYVYISNPLHKGKARHLLTNPRKPTILSGVWPDSSAPLNRYN